MDDDRADCLEKTGDEDWFLSGALELWTFTQLDAADAAVDASYVCELWGMCAERPPMFISLALHMPAIIGVMRMTIQ